MTTPTWLLTALCAVPLILVCYYFLDWSSPTAAGVEKIPEMEISEIYVYPIKSLRAVKLDSATATAHGFAHDRTFMLLEKTSTSTSGYKNMAVSSYPHMTQFLQEISPSSSSTSKLHDSDGDAKLTIRYLACGDASKQSSLTIPLTPSTKNLQTLEVNMHGSATLAHRMPDHYNAWFTSCFGFAVELVYLGSHRRSPRFSDMMSSSSSSSSPSPPSPIPSPLAHLKSLLPTPTSPLTSQALTFADCAPYLFCTTASLDSVSQRLQLPSTALAPASAAATATKPMDITKFRPNIVLAGAQQAWHEDYWASLRIFSSSGQKKMDNTTTNQTNVSLVHNCVRCKSINIDYATGKPGAGPTGEVLKRLQADRRVDVGARWSPVFGRYGFWEGSGKGKGKGKGKDDNGEEVVWSVGDKVRVTRVNKERTVWSWPNLG